MNNLTPVSLDVGESAKIIDGFTPGTAYFEVALSAGAGPNRAPGDVKPSWKWRTALATNQVNGIRDEVDDSGNLELAPPIPFTSGGTTTPRNDCSLGAVVPRDACCPKMDPAVGSCNISLQDFLFLLQLIVTWLPNEDLNDWVIRSCMGAFRFIGKLRSHISSHHGKTSYYQSGNMVLQVQCTLVGRTRIMMKVKKLNIAVDTAA
ncbi:hypothetical protein AJ78_00180 [Emergomyces pasteurianus Ep9510]|uniref:Uncharacterized protein n=1 Tax=Emergomyces pasteurianus Ep9510 TaxID=1447872 RepID=A0A1J9QWY0_9EURO|nr:hypothetical protein AJ78_00180 [Emergomyces pasteurianus Ep9510]